ncbi:hypothetical protein ACED27_23290 [Vibrio sp. FF112]|uniref:hypothetical protein n=1 Tax=unclassified Vibrio TaxID=2614977 RepID=UPI00352F160F
MFWNKKKRYLLSELNGHINTINAERASIPIAVIDDLDVPYIEAVRNCGYKGITHYTDIDNFEMLSVYQVIICDIRGVGKKLSKNEGAFIIQQLRKVYPDKYIIAMSSNLYHLPIQNYIGVADAKLKRDVSSDRVIREIEKGVAVMSSRKERWLRFRDYLLKTHQMDLYDVWQIEQEFIKSVLTHDRKGFEESDVLKKHGGDMVKGLLVNFISGIIF